MKRKSQTDRVMDELEKQALQYISYLGKVTTEGGMDLFVEWMKGESMVPVPEELEQYAMYLYDKDTVAKLEERVRGKMDNDVVDVYIAYLLAEAARILIENAVDELGDFKTPESEQQAIDGAWYLFLEETRSGKPNFFGRDKKKYGKYIKDPRYLEAVIAKLDKVGINVKGAGHDFGEESRAYENSMNPELVAVPDNVAPEVPAEHASLVNVDVDGVESIGLAELANIVGDAPKIDDEFDSGVKRFVVDHVDYPAKTGVIRRIAN